MGKLELFIIRRHLQQTTLSSPPLSTQIHNDEAVRVIALYAGDESWTEQEEKKLRMKPDRRLLSIL